MELCGCPEYAHLTRNYGTFDCYGCCDIYKALLDEQQ
jgi:hypothetical protein